MMAINLLICLSIALAAIWAVILATFQRWSIQSYNMDDALDTMRRITDVTTEMLQLPLEKRAAKRRMIVKDILRDLGFVLYLTEAYRFDDHAEIRERTWELMSKIVSLQLELQKIRFLSRFRPRLVADCRRTLEAIQGHYSVWVAYIRLLKAKYPERYRDVSVEDIQ